MTTKDHLLIIAMEECAEVAQRCFKALRFGLGEIQLGQTLTNAERIMVEFDDLLAVVCMLQGADVLPASDSVRVAAKASKVTHFLNYSKEQGTLSDPAPTTPPTS